MTDTKRRGSGAGAKRATGAGPSASKPLGDVSPNIRHTVASWLKSPACDFYAIVIIGGLLVGIGLVMVLSSSSVGHIARGLSPFGGFLSQAIFAMVGLVAAAITVCLPISLLKKMWCAHLILLLGLALQALVFVPGIGMNVNGNLNWIRIGSLQGQPSEFLKIALALWLGAYLAHNRDRLRNVSTLVIAAVAILLSLGLVVGGRDLGTMMMMAALAIGALWAAGVPKRWFAVVMLVGGAGVLAFVLQSPNRMARVGNWLHGECPGDSCWQSDNGLMALAEGGITGVGLGGSRQKWGRIPHAENDFIFAIIGEELGLLGTLTVVVLFALLAIVLYRVMMRNRDPFVQITTAAISTWLIVQAFVNMSVVVGLLPVLGVPLPFVSAGGSALVASMIALGLLANFARNEPGAREAISARAWFARRSATVVAGSDAALTPRRAPRRKRTS